MLGFSQGGAKCKKKMPKNQKKSGARVKKVGRVMDSMVCSVGASRCVMESMAYAGGVARCVMEPGAGAAGAGRRRKRRGVSVYSVSSYSLPKLHEGKKWFVDFLCYDPVEGKMRRKKYHLDGIKGVRERRRRAAELIAEITARLRQGWNCWADVESSRGYTLYDNVVGLYRAYMDKLLKTGAIKLETYRGNLSYLLNFDGWLRSAGRPVVYVYQLDRVLLSEFLDYMFLVRDVSALTRNHYRAWLYGWCGWMVEKGYLAENPVEGIKQLRAEPKMRDALPAEELARLQSYLSERNPWFLLACMMEYYTFIRPEELTHVRVGDIRVREMKVMVSGTFTKNRRDGAVALNETVIRLMIDLGVFRCPGGDYLFGGRDFRPGPRRQSGRIFREEFARVRAALGWPMSYQFYSLKDSGIRDLANAEGIVVARDQARHSDISTTNRYLKGDALAVHEEVKRFKGGL